MVLDRRLLLSSGEQLSTMIFRTMRAPLRRWRPRVVIDVTRYKVAVFVMSAMFAS